MQGGALRFFLPPYPTSIRIYKEELGEVKGTKRELRSGLHDKVKANTPPLQGAD